MGARAERPMTWRVTYQRVDHHDAHAPERSSLAGEVVLAGGELPAFAAPAHAE